MLPHLFSICLIIFPVWSYLFQNIVKSFKSMIGNFSFGWLCCVHGANWFKRVSFALSQKDIYAWAYSQNIYPGFPWWISLKFRAKVQDAEECSTLKRKLDESVAQRLTLEEQNTKKDKRIHKLQSRLKKSDKNVR